MKAVGLLQYLPIEQERSLQDFQIECPIAQGNDLLVAVQAISVNPVDTKVRAPKNKRESLPKILGWDAAGTVVEVGEQVTGFKRGDDVFYAGDITRPGSNSEFQLIDERIVGHKPKNLDFAQAASLPLTGLTAWESLFDRLHLSSDGTNHRQTILIINGAGGVGSIAIQLAKQLAKVTVIATASRPETRDWCLKLGADHVVNHRHNLAAEIKRAGFENVDAILCLNDTDGHWSAITQAIAPQGKICAVVGNKGPLDMTELKNKSASLHWEFMFTRSKYQTADIDQQRSILNRISQLVEAGDIVTTCREVVRPINARNLRSVHQRIEQGNTIGKITLADWPS
ncbi:MAG: zinc-binding alcohol dehydrogenase family protein [Cyanobacteria bacterium P01_F01_bin.42]